MSLQSQSQEQLPSFALKLGATLFITPDSFIKDGDVVRVIDEFRAHVRQCDLGVPAEVREYDYDSAVVYLVWPSGTGLWVDVENMRAVP